MSTTTTARRIALLSSSSLGLAAIVSAASLGAALTPTAALAQTATCTSGTAVNNNGTAAVTIAGGNPNNPGITCLYTGDTATVATLGTMTVSTVAPGGGINLSATGTDDVNWISTVGTITGGAQTNGPVIDAQTAAGTININTAGVTGSQATITHGIRAQSTSGPINITSTGTVSATNATSGLYGIQATTAGAIDITTATVTTARDGILAQSTGGGDITLTTGAVGFGTNAGNTAIEAISNGGDISVITNGAIGSTSNSLTVNSTNRDGIVVQTSGLGAVNLDLNAAVTAYGPGGAAVRVTNGTGDVSIDAAGAIRGGDVSFNGAHLASAIVVDSGGDVVINSSSTIMGGVNSGAERSAAIVASGQNFTLTLTGDPNAAPDRIAYYTASLGGDNYYDGFGGLHRLGTAGTFGGHTGGHIDLSGITEGAELNFNSRARWVLSDTSLLSPGADAVNIDATSILTTNSVGRETGPTAELPDDFDQTLIPPGVIDFGGGTDGLTNLGRVLVGPAISADNTVGEGPGLPPGSSVRRGIRGEIRLLNLEQFVNSGEIWLGAHIHNEGSTTRTLVGTDEWTDDMLYMPGASFHGAEGSAVYMDVNLNATQSSCAPSARDQQGYLAADCIGIQGGAATGRTELHIVELVPGDRGQYNPDGIVLIDLAGGDPDATDPRAFIVSPDTPNYIDVGNGGIEKGVFAYILGFDADTQQFKLVGAPSSGAQQFPILATAANQLWRTATGGWFQRRVHQRDVGYEGLGTGAWFNVTGMGTERDISTSVAIGTDDVVFDNSYEQSDVAISFGWDLLDYGSDAALGAMVGYAHSEVEFDDSDNSANLEGVHAGLYGGYGAGGFFIDGAINGAILSLHNDVPAMDLQPSGTVLDTEVWSLGGRVEAGWRFNAQGGLWLEPLVGASAVSTSFEDMRVPNGDPDPNRPGVNVRLDSAESRRASAGLRFGVTDMWANVAPTSFSVTARAVNEFEGGADVSVENIGPTYLSTDALEGTFTQVTGSVSVASPNKAISGYLNLDTIKGDDYDSMGASIGVRLHW